MKQKIRCQRCECNLTISDALVYNDQPICSLCAEELQLEAYAMNTLGDKALLNMLGFVPKRSKPFDK
ncbi:MAG: hypothetical protein NC548_05490 [Lachnospiraceae bacterium]|nr:hypothetical protein [Lachnospiraceae bacterium]